MTIKIRSLDRMAIEHRMPRSSRSGRVNVTLEFSNTTPLPAKIYANEGVALCYLLRNLMPTQRTERE
jgi:hypothetical protein